MDDVFKQQALDYHEFPKPGKLQIQASKPLANQRDLALAYSPGVAVPCMAIHADPAAAARYTNRGNMVVVVTNGTAVLGLGDIGPLAAKPVMEGKAVLFKKFAGVDAFDLEFKERDPQRLAEMLAALEPSVAGIHLEDIKAPECFELEARLQALVNIPVFHDDQHGTAMIVSAAVRNYLRLSQRDWGDLKVVVSGAGAAAVACMELLIEMGLPRSQLWVFDREGLIVQSRAVLAPAKARFAQPGPAQSLSAALQGAHVFLGVSSAGALSPEALLGMASQPLILALANPTPEIMPEVARATRADAILATGRSDYPNQVNNVLCYPYIFRGALDVGASCINLAMKKACVQALADLALEAHAPDAVSGYEQERPPFGPDYLIPHAFDSRLIMRLAPAVARAAMESGVATRPISDWHAYADHLQQFVYRSNWLMKPVFSRARSAQARVVFAEGEDPKILQAVQVVLNEGLARPVLIGRPQVITARLQRLGLPLVLGRDVEVINQEADARFKAYWQFYWQHGQRDGVTPTMAQMEVRANPSLIGAIAVLRGEAEALLCGTHGEYLRHLQTLKSLAPQQGRHNVYAAMHALLLPEGPLFIVDTHVNVQPSVDELERITLLAAEHVSRFGIVPKIALLSHSSFGSHATPSSCTMRALAERLRQRAPHLEVEGEMQGDVALSETLRRELLPDNRLQGRANLLVMPNLDAANIAFKLLKVTAGDGVTVGPMLLGADFPAHILTPAASVRRLVNMTALAAADAWLWQQSGLD